MPKVPKIPIAKIVTVSAIGMAIGFGTCGLGLLGGGPHRIAVSAGLILFFLSLATLVITALFALAKFIGESFRK